MAKIIKNCKVRMDFEIEEIPSENGKTTRKVIFKPNEKRYELREYDGKQGYFDKIDNIFIPHDLLLESLNSKENMPIYAPPSRIENLIEYFEERYSKLDKYYTQTIRTTDNQEFLKSNIGSTKEFVFMSIDIVNSTDRSKKMGIETNTKTNLMFLNEINRILIRFDGHVMKYLGDGLIAYFTTPNIVGKVDNSLDCSSAIKYFTENYINKFLIEKDIPPIDFRIGINVGEGYIVEAGSQEDIYGHALDITNKIQKNAGKNEIWISSDASYLAHTEWRERLKKVALSEIHELNGMTIYQLNF